MKKTIALAFFLFVSLSCIAQLDVFLQIEEIENPESIKFGVGSSLEFIAADYSDGWQKGTIKEIYYDSQSILFDHTVLTLQQISKIRLINPAGNIAGYALKGFGASWLAFGGIADLAGLNENKNLDAQNIGIGVLSIGMGELIQRTSGRKVYHNNNRNYRFRIIDLRMSIDDK